MRRLLALSFLISSLACGCAAGLAAPASLAAGSSATTQPSFSLTSPGASSTPPTTTPTPVTTTSASSGGLSGLDGVIIAVVAVVVLGGIAFWVWYDARGHLARIGHGHEDSLFGQRAHAGSKAARKQRKLTPAERRRRKRGRAR
jgi:hypothetical protein